MRGFIPFPWVFARKWTYYRDWSTNSLTTIPQSIALTITPCGHSGLIINPVFFLCGFFIHSFFLSFLLLIHPLFCFHSGFIINPFFFVSLFLHPSFILYLFSFWIPFKSFLPLWFFLSFFFWIFLSFFLSFRNILPLIIYKTNKNLVNWME